MAKTGSSWKSPAWAGSHCSGDKTGHEVEEEFDSQQVAQCPRVSGKREKGRIWMSSTRASHVVTGTKMTPVAERWPEPDFCSFPREQCLVTGSTHDCAVKSPNSYKGCVRLRGTLVGNIALGLLFEKSKCTVPDVYGMPMSDWYVPCCRFMHTFCASPQLH